MKRLVVALLASIIPTMVAAEWGVEMSHRPVPAYVSDTYADGTATTFHTIQTGMLSLHWGDTLKGRSKTTGGYWEVRYFINVWEEPSEKYPVGRMVEREVAIGDATPQDINEKNKWNKPGSRVSKVYSRRVWVKSKVKGVLPSWTNPNKGAGYIVNMNLMMGSVDRVVDIYGIDLLLGKRLTIIPHFFGIYGKVGPTLLAEVWHRYGWAEQNTALGAILSGGAQIQILKGIKFFGEVEFRGYGPLIHNENSSSVVLVNKLPFMAKEVRDHYRDYERNAGMDSYRDLVKESLRFGLRFTF